MEPYEKIYVKPAFLETEHGKIACRDCHGGNPADPDWRTAHNGLVRDPTWTRAAEVCGKCHKDIAASAPEGLHYTLAPFTKTLKARIGPNNPARDKVLAAAQRHCGACHASCGQCHVSRPDYADGGFLAGHKFSRPSMEVTCASCHGGRVYGDFTGAWDKIEPDAHFEPGEMSCADCHGAKEMHARAQGVRTRFELPQRPDCLDCHPKAAPGAGQNRAHDAHKGRLACQVCHSQAQKSCYDCHTGTDDKGLAFFKCARTEFSFKIGLNPAPTKDRPQRFVVLRHPPANPGLFDFYAKNGLADFNALPTWKLDTPHNIRRVTAQNKTCNDCHGHPELFLKTGDLAPGEGAANAKVVVPEAMIPSRLQKSAGKPAGRAEP
ncbi:MAG: hypothetical protein JW718_02010 [Desulfovibrionaceae bacterium]|nr:hypothetical protein [Desulfovibrionaceae bacterium]